MAAAWCAGTASSPVHADDLGRPKFRSVALLPFYEGQKPPGAESILELTPEQMGLVETMAPGSARTMTMLTQAALERKYGDAVLPLEEVRRAFDEVYTTETDKRPRNIVMKIAEKLGVSYIVAGNIWRFSEREGRSLAASKPASVAFRLHLIDISKHERVWFDTYDKTQQALSENILKASDFIKEGGKWLKASELADLGVDELVKKMPL
jgi:hypothetical protein